MRRGERHGKVRIMVNMLCVKFPHSFLARRRLLLGDIVQGDFCWAGAAAPRMHRLYPTQQYLLRQTAPTSGTSVSKPCDISLVHATVGDLGFYSTSCESRALKGHVVGQTEGIRSVRRFCAPQPIWWRISGPR